MSNSAKYGMLVLLLLTCTVTFVLINMKDWQSSVTSCFSRPVPKCPTTAPAPKPRTTTTAQDLQPEASVCSFKYLSPENAVEGRRLLDSITWPETLPLPNPFSLYQTSNAEKSTFTILPRSGDLRVGDELRVRIQVNDYNGNPKKAGGDFIIARLHNRELGAGVVGQVLDHLNGTFSAIFPLLWNGAAEVEVILVQSSESITVLKRLTEEQPDRISFQSDFRSGSISESITCNVCLDSKQGPLCNFTDKNTGEQWFCRQPKKLSCDTRIDHTFGGFYQRISKDEETLFQKGVNMKAFIKPMGMASVVVLPRVNQAGQTEASRSERPSISGYYYQDEWRPLGGTKRQFNNASAITQCLKGKVMHLFGDSTIRQYFEHFMNVAPNLKKFDLHTGDKSGPFLALDYANNIKMTYRSHGPPIRFRSAQLRYVANEVDGITGGPDTVIVIGVWSHFSTFPMEVYYQRLQSIQRAVKRLHNRAPATKVIIRTANPKDLTLYESLTNSDWFSLQHDKVLRAVFRDTDVLLLEAWEMGQAHHLPHSLHPQPQIIKHMIDVVLSYTCPV